MHLPFQDTLYPLSFVLWLMMKATESLLMKFFFKFKIVSALSDIEHFILVFVLY